MKHQLILVVLALSALFGGSQAAAQTFPYQVKLLGISDGRSNIQVEVPAGLNRWGQVIGAYGGGVNKHAVLWTPTSANDGNDADVGTFTALESSPGIPAGTAGSWLTGINDRGQVVGGSYTPGHGDGSQTQSWMWKPAPLNDLKGLHLSGTKGKAITFGQVEIPGFGILGEHGESINNNGVITAFGIFYHPLLWTPAKKNGTTGTWTYEPLLSAPPSGINDAGQIVGGTIESLSQNAPYLHSGPFPIVASDVLNSPLWVQPPTPNGIGSASGINQRGDLSISASDATTGLGHAYLYKNGAATDLSTGLPSAALAINNFDQVVGFLSDTGRAALFENGSVMDLNTLIDPAISNSELLLKKAIAINDAGQILCTGGFPGAGASVLLTPAVTNSTGQVSLGPPQLTHNGATYFQTVMVTNNGATIAGPVSFVLDGLTAGITLTNATGTTVYAGAGSPYFNFSTGDFGPGASIPVTLVFSNPGHKAIKYTVRILAGPAPR